MVYFLVDKNLFKIFAPKIIGSSPLQHYEMSEWSGNVAECATRNEANQLRNKATRINTAVRVAKRLQLPL